MTDNRLTKGSFWSSSSSCCLEIARRVRRGRKAWGKSGHSSFHGQDRTTIFTGSSGITFPGFLATCLLKINIVLKQRRLPVLAQFTYLISSTRVRFHRSTNHERNFAADSNGISVEMKNFNGNSGILFRAQKSARWEWIRLSQFTAIIRESLACNVTASMDSTRLRKQRNATIKNRKLLFTLPSQ